MNPKELIRILENKLQESPLDEEAKEQLAFLLISQGNLSRAEILLSEIISSHPESSSALWGLAKINWQKNHYDKAHSYLSSLASHKSNKLNKEQALIYAKVLAKKQDFSEASKWLDIAIGQDSSLLQSEISFLKFINHHLSLLQENKKTNDNSSSDNPLALGFGFPFPFPFPPIALANKHTQYVVFEISHYEQKEPISPDNNSDFGFNGESSNSTQNTDEDTDKEVFSNSSRKIVTFDQVGGLRKVKQALIQELILPLKNPQLCSLYSKSTNPKILLYGPSGCGKSFISRALSHEAEINFLLVKSSDFCDLDFEEAEARLANIIQVARESKPAIIYLDEILWLAHQNPAPENLNQSYFFRSNLLNTLINNLSPDYPMNDQIGLLVNTSKPWYLDAEFLASNKINKHIFVGPPSNQDKAEILNIILEQKETPVLNPEKIDVNKVINSLKKLNSAGDLHELVESALSDLLIETVVNLQNGQKEKKLYLTTERLIKTGKRLKQIPLLENWLNEAKKHLKFKDSLLKPLWEQVDEYLEAQGEGFKFNFTTRTIKNKLISPK